MQGATLPAGFAVWMLEPIFAHRAAVDTLKDVLGRHSSAKRLFRGTTVSCITKPGLARERVTEKVLVDREFAALVMASSADVKAARCARKPGPKRVAELIAQHGARTALLVVLSHADASTATRSAALEAALGAFEDESLSQVADVSATSEPASSQSDARVLRALEKRVRELERSLASTKAQLSATTRDRDRLKAGQAWITDHEHAATTTAEQLRTSEQTLKEVSERYTQSKAHVQRLEGRLAAMQADHDRLTADSVRFARATEPVGETGSPEALAPSEILYMAASLLRDLLRDYALCDTSPTAEMVALANGVHAIETCASIAFYVEPASESCAPERDDLPAGYDADAFAEGGGAQQHRPAGGLDILSADEAAEVDRHNAMREVERVERQLFSAGVPSRLLIDGHNVIFRNGFRHREADGRQWLIGLVSRLAQRTGAEVLTVFDTRYPSTDQDLDHGARVVYTSSREGGADARLIEELRFPTAGVTMVCSNDFRHVISAADQAANDGLAVVGQTAELLYRYLRALEGIGDDDERIDQCGVRADSRACASAL